MSKYKHGNWYCKPANEAEAREIIHRAVANGAKLFESIGRGKNKYTWNLLSGWGVFNNQTFVGNANDSWATYRTEEYTIEQVREKFPLPHEVKK